MHASPFQLKHILSYFTILSYYTYVYVYTHIINRKVFYPLNNHIEVANANTTNMPPSRSLLYTACIAH